MAETETDVDPNVPLSNDDADWLVGQPENLAPVALEEGDAALAQEPPDDWDPDAHAEAYLDDPLVDATSEAGA